VAKTDEGHPCDVAGDAGHGDGFGVARHDVDHIAIVGGAEVDGLIDGTDRGCRRSALGGVHAAIDKEDLAERADRLETPYRRAIEEQAVWPHL
jgi:hypothetical protein